MNKLTVWIIEDESDQLRKAIDELLRITRQSSLSMELGCSDNWSWPPKLQPVGQDGQVGTVAQSFHHLPALVVLDLFEDGDKFKGQHFYDQLRLVERQSKKNSESFVISWSSFWSKPESVRFVLATQESDDRFISLDSKDSDLLGQTVRRCLERIEEENSIS